MKSVIVLAALLLSTSAFALPAQPSVFDKTIFPPPGLAIVQNVAFRVSPGVRFARIDERGRTPLVVVGAAGGGSLGTVDVGALIAGDTLVIEASCDACEDVTLQWPITDVVDEVAPVLTGVTPQIAVGVDGNPDFWGIQICIPPLEPNEAVLLLIDSDAGSLVRSSPVDDTGTPVMGGCLMGADEVRVDGTFAYLTMRDEGQETFCLTTTAIDVAGNSASTGEVCLPIEPYEQFETDAGCAAAPTAPLSALLLGLAGLLSRRRMG